MINIMTVFASLIGGLFIAIILYSFVAFRLTKLKRLQMIDWFLLSLATFNGLGFAFVLWSTFGGRNSYTWTHRIIQYDAITVLQYLSSNLILAFAVITGWYISIALTNKYRHQKPSVLNYSLLIRNRKRFTIVAWIMVLIAILAYSIYTRPYGGFIGILKYSRAIRAGVFFVNNPYSFLKRFGGFAFFASYIFLGLILDTKKEKVARKNYYIGFCLSFVFSLYINYEWLGRLTVATYFLTLILGYILYNYKTVFGLVRKGFIFIVSALFVTIGADRILEGTNHKIGIIELFASELSFPFASYIIQNDYYQFRWFKDVIVAPLFVLPERIWSGIFNIEPASSYNTLIVAGARKGEGGVSGSIPLDMLTFGHLQGSIIGILFIGIIFGCFLFFLEKRIDKLPVKGVKSVIYANVVLNIAVFSVLYGDTQHIIIRNFPLIGGSLLIWFILKFNIKRNKFRSTSIIQDK